MKILGIDLGTTNSAAAVWDRGRGEVVPNHESTGLRTLPSIVSLRPNAEAVVGEAARAYGTANPQFTFTGLKRLVGRSYDDPYMQGILDAVPYDIVDGADGQAWVQGPDRLYSPEELLALVLKKLKRFAEIQHQEQVGHCVLAVPAYFDEIQKGAVRRAAQMAGLEVLRTIPEPTAAALAYGLERGGDRTILVYDFGGGTFDVSILRVKAARFKTLAQAGDTGLGGSNFDMAIAAHLAERFEARFCVDPRTDIYALHRLIIAAEQCKRQLSSVDELPYMIDRVIKIPDTFDIPSFDFVLTRDELEDICADLVEASFDPVRQALSDAKLTPAEIDEVVLVGGQTGMPMIRRAVAQFFGREPLRDINPDEAVALGAAVYAATLTNEIKSINVNEIATHTIGVELADGTLAPLVKRKDPLARRRVKIYPMSEAGQAAAAVRVFQGERPMAWDNRHLATLVVENLTPAGVEVTLDYDVFGVLQMAARDASGGVPVVSGVHLTTGLDEDAVAGLRGVDDDDDLAGAA
jgi:molecular chaperone DnaK